MKAALLRFARKIVEGVLSDLGRQLNIVQEMAYKPMQMMVQQVTGGVWIGKGADAFTQEISSLMMPNVAKIAETIVKTQKNIKFASDVIDRGDQQVRSKVNALADVFGQIANGL